MRANVLSAIQYPATECTFVVRRHVGPQRNVAGSRLDQETWQQERPPQRMTTTPHVSLCCR